MPELATTKRETKGVFGWLAVALFLVTYFIARAILEMSGLSTGARIAAALIPVPAYIYFLRSFVRGIRRLDELERRIQLEALAIAFPLATVLLLTLGLLELAIQLPPEDLSYRHVWALLPVLYFTGLALARRRYL